jgi:uncharacterized protein (DUF302 family)
MTPGNSPSKSLQGEGIVTKPSPRSVDETVAKLKEILQSKGVNLFTIVDHSGEAQRAGLQMPNTKLAIFGNPKAGTPVMLEAPLAALDLPLKILLWEDHDGNSFISFNDPAYLADRYHLGDAQAAPIRAVEGLVNALGTQ